MNLTESKEAIGTIVHISDGTPRPPAHHTRKVGVWKCNNYSGILDEISKYPEGSYEGYQYSILTMRSHHARSYAHGEITALQHGDHPARPTDLAVSE